MPRHAIVVLLMTLALSGCILDYTNHARDGSFVADTGVDGAPADGGLDAGQDVGPTDAMTPADTGVDAATTECAWECPSCATGECDDPVDVSSGDVHSCAVRAGGTVVCWGFNDSGKLGTGDRLSRDRPTTVVGVGAAPVLTGIVQVAAGGLHSCARTTAEQILCWGADDSGQIGAGSPSDTTRPNVVEDPATGTSLSAVDLASGTRHSCATLRGGFAACWGNNEAGQLGDGTTDNRSTAVRVQRTVGGSSLDGVSQVSAGAFHSCARVSSAQVMCWGRNDVGQLGTGSPSGSPIPLNVIAVTGAGVLTDVTQVTSGSFHSCARLVTGELVCWGDNAQGQLGDGTSDRRDRPVYVAAAEGAGRLLDVATVAAHGFHTCATLTSGALVCWGSNAQGRLGNGDVGGQRVRPVSVLDVTGAGGLTGVAQAAPGGQHTCARLLTGHIVCWGSNVRNQLGDGMVMDRPIPGFVLSP